MATTTKKQAETPTKAKRTAKAPEATTESPQAPVFLPNEKMPPVRPGTHRAYAQEIARKLAKSNPKGFTLQQFKDELIKAADGSTIAPPKGGWQAHNMPTWMAHEKQKWLVPADSKEAADPKKLETAA